MRLLEEVVQRRYSCDACSASFVSPRLLDQHRVLHRTAKKLSRPKARRRRRYRSLAGSPPRGGAGRGRVGHRCTTCSKLFDKPSQLLRHLRIHTGEKPFKCQHPGCGRAFNQQGTLATHQTTHTGHRPHPCTLCSKRFSQRSNLVCHVRRVHPVGAAAVTGYRCDECSCVFRRPGSLNAHISQVHSRPVQLVQVEPVQQKRQQVGQEQSSDKGSAPPGTPQPPPRAPQPPPARILSIKKDVFIKNLKAGTFFDAKSCSPAKTNISPVKTNINLVCVTPDDILKRALVNSGVDREPSGNSGAIAIPADGEDHGSADEEPKTKSPDVIRQDTFGQNCTSDNSFVVEETFGDANVTDMGQNSVTEYNDVASNVARSDQDVVTNAASKITREATDVTEITGDDITKTTPKVMKTMPEVSKTMDEVTKTISKVTKTRPEVTRTEDVTKTGAGDVTKGPSERSRYVMVTLSDRVNEVVRKYQVVVKYSKDAKYHHCCFANCPKEFRKPSDLLRHLRVHTNDKPFKCHKCFRAFRVKSTLMGHLKTHAPARDHVCPTCNKGFSSAATLKLHSWSHEGRPPFTCPSCGKGFRSFAARKTHLAHFCPLAGGAGKSNPPPPRRRKGDRLAHGPPCPLPDIPLQEPILITEHGRVPQVARNADVYNPCPATPRRRPHRCRFCPAALKKSSHLRQHERIHTGERPHLCPLCPKAFSSPSVLRAHQRTHLGVKTSSCPLCQRFFATPSSVKRHLSTHSQARPFMCPYCEKTFKTNSSCKKHLQIHLLDLTMQAVRSAGQNLQADQEDAKKMVATFQTTNKIAGSLQNENQVSVAHQTEKNISSSLQAATTMAASYHDRTMNKIVSSYEPTNKITVCYGNNKDAGVSKGVTSTRNRLLLPAPVCSTAAKLPSVPSSDGIPSTKFITVHPNPLPPSGGNNHNTPTPVGDKHPVYNPNKHPSITLSSGGLKDQSPSITLDHATIPTITINSASLNNHLPTITIDEKGSVIVTGDGDVPAKDLQDSMDSGTVKDKVASALPVTPSLVTSPQVTSSTMTSSQVTSSGNDEAPTDVAENSAAGGPLQQLLLQEEGQQLLHADAGAAADPFSGGLTIHLPAGIDLTSITQEQLLQLLSCHDVVLASEYPHDKPQAGDIPKKSSNIPSNSTDIVDKPHGIVDKPHGIVDKTHDIVGNRVSSSEIDRKSGAVAAFSSLVDQKSDENDGKKPVDIERNHVDIGGNNINIVKNNVDIGRNHVDIGRNNVVIVEKIPEMVRKSTCDESIEMMTPDNDMAFRAFVINDNGEIDDYDDTDNRDNRLTQPYDSLPANRNNKCIDNNGKHYENNKKHYDNNNKHYDNSDNKYETDRPKHNIGIKYENNNVGYDNKDTRYANRDTRYANKDSSYVNKDSSYDNKDSSYDNKDSSYDNKDSNYDNNGAEEALAAASEASVNRRKRKLSGQDMMTTCITATSRPPTTTTTVSDGSNTTVKRRRKHGPVTHTCVVCKAVHDTRALLVEHMSSAHPTQHWCEVCQQLLPSLAHLHRHRSSNHQQWRCPVCGEVLYSVVSVQHHLRLHPRQLVTTALLGPLSQRQYGKARRGRTTSDTEDVATSGGVATSPDEGTAVLPNARNLRRCQHCGKTFKKPSDLTRHIRTHTGEKPYSCGQCGKTFAVKSTLDAHVRSHSGSKSCQCPVCHTYFASKGSFSIHMRIHTGDKPLQCPYCLMKFRTSGHRKAHILGHFKTNPGDLSNRHEGKNNQEDLRDGALRNKYDVDNVRDRNNSHAEVKDSAEDAKTLGEVEINFDDFKTEPHDARLSGKNTTLRVATIATNTSYKNGSGGASSRKGRISGSGGMGDASIAVTYTTGNDIGGSRNANPTTRGMGSVSRNNASYKAGVISSAPDANVGISSIVLADDEEEEEEDDVNDVHNADEDLLTQNTIDVRSFPGTPNPSSRAIFPQAPLVSQDPQDSGQILANVEQVSNADGSISLILQMPTSTGALQQINLSNIDPTSLLSLTSLQQLSSLVAAADSDEGDDGLISGDVEILDGNGDRVIGDGGDEVEEHDEFVGYQGEVDVGNDNDLLEVRDSNEDIDGNGGLNATVVIEEADAMTVDPNAVFRRQASTTERANTAIQQTFKGTRTSPAFVAGKHSTNPNRLDTSVVATATTTHLVNHRLNPRMSNSTSQLKDSTCLFCQATFATKHQLGNHVTGSHLTQVVENHELVEKMGLILRWKDGTDDDDDGGGDGRRSFSDLL